VGEPVCWATAAEEHRATTTQESVVVDEDLGERRNDPRYHRLMEATRAAAARGYDAVSMRELANVTRMSLTTVYQFCSSKDHLIAEAHVDRMVAMRDRVVRKPPGGQTPEERVLKVVRAIVDGLDRDDPLSWALMRAMYAPDPAVRSSRRATADSFTAMMDAAIGDTEVPERPAVIATLGHVVDSAILGWVHGSLEADDAYREIAQAVHLLVRPAAERRPRPAVASRARKAEAEPAKPATTARPRYRAPGR
jgi:TetR/AcrR family transcriptional regulator, cholesterol catabolism regulator